MLRIKELYHNEIRGRMMKEFGYKNPMQVPRIQKIVLNIGLGEAIQNIKLLDGAVEELTAIAGQKAVVTRARRSIAAFKLREGMPIGAMVTMRRDRMYDFLDKLINLVLPRVRDFRGITPKGFDGRGNYTLGIKEQISHIYREGDITERPEAGFFEYFPLSWIDRNDFIAVPHEISCHPVAIP